MHLIYQTSITFSAFALDGTCRLCQCCRTFNKPSYHFPSDPWIPILVLVTFTYVALGHILGSVRRILAFNLPCLHMQATPHVLIDRPRLPGVACLLPAFGSGSLLSLPLRTH